jgi:hypothetical protein
LENDEKTVPMDNPEMNPASRANQRVHESSTRPETPEEEGYGDGYPLRPPEEDPRWAVNTVRIWLGFALFSLAIILILLLLGVFYD